MIEWVSSPVDAPPLAQRQHARFVVRREAVLEDVVVADGSRHAVGREVDRAPERLGAVEDLLRIVLPVLPSAMFSPHRPSDATSTVLFTTRLPVEEPPPSIRYSEMPLACVL